MPDLFGRIEYVPIVSLVLRPICSALPWNLNLALRHLCLF